MEQFETALEDWKGKAHQYNELRQEHELAWGKAYAESSGKNDGARKAEADEATMQSREEAEAAEVERDAAYHLMRYLRDHGVPSCE